MIDRELALCSFWVDGFCVSEPILVPLLYQVHFLAFHFHYLTKMACQSSKIKENSKMKE